MPYYKLRTLLISFAIGLVFVELGMFLLPDSVNLPGGMAGWLVFMFLFWRAIPIAIIVALSVAALTHYSGKAT